MTLDNIYTSHKRKIIIMEPISKKDAKMDKIHRKGQSSHTQVLQRGISNSSLSQNLSEERKILNKDEIHGQSFIDPETQMKKSKEWWQQLDKTYFKAVNRKNILLTRDLTTGEKLRSFFNLQTQLQCSYEDEEIYGKFPLLRQNTLIHVLFKSSNPFFMELVTYSFANYIQCPNKRALKVHKQQHQEIISMDNFNISSVIKKLRGQNLAIQKSQQQVEQILKIGNLELQAILQDDLWICKFQKTMQIKNQMEFSEDIQVQLKLWENQVDQQNTQNSILWNNVISNHENTIETQHRDFTTQVAKIRQNLMHFTILRYIEYGTKDKTHEMVKQLLDNMKQTKPAKTRQVTSKKFFETDCKICFCSFNSDSNQVLYCDMCNTSFHLACYGLHEVPQDKEYFCDRCRAIRKDEKTKNNIRKITCQICCKPNFPIKQIGGHYYHMTCLILLNFSKKSHNIVTIHEGRIELRADLSHSKIINRVIQSQLECQACIFCLGGQGAQLGMQFRCSVPGCECSMHPICAYINGCLFEIEKNMALKRVQVMVRCNLHDYERDYIQQTYLRRYMCNFKNTSQQTLQSFTVEYQAETQARLLKLPFTHQAHTQLPKIIFDSKVIRKHICLREPKNTQKQQEVPNTEIRKLLQKLQRPKNKI